MGQEEDRELQFDLDSYKQFPKTAFRQLPIWDRHLVSRLVASLFLAHERHNHNVQIAYMEQYKTFLPRYGYDPSIENWEVRVFTEGMHDLEERKALDKPLLKDSPTGGTWDRTAWRSICANVVDNPAEVPNDVIHQAIANRLEEYIFCYLVPEAEFFYLHSEYENASFAEDDLEDTEILVERAILWGLNIETDHEDYSPMRINLIDRKYAEAEEWLKDLFVQERITLVADFLYNDPSIDFFPDEINENLDVDNTPNEVHALKIDEAHELLLQWEQEKFGT